MNEWGEKKREGTEGRAGRLPLSEIINIPLDPHADHCQGPALAETGFRDVARVTSRGTRAWNGVPIVKVFKNALWTALRTIFRQKTCIGLQDFAYILTKPPQ